MSPKPTNLTTQSGDSRYRQAPGTLTRRDPDGMLLLPPGAEDPLLLEGIGPIVWTLLERASTHGELTDDLAELFARPVPEIRDGLHALLEHLMIAGALCVD